MAKENLEKSRKLALKDYYERLPKATFPRTNFINEICSACGVSFSTARNWVLGISSPKYPKEVGDKLSKITGIPQTELWQ